MNDNMVWGVIIAGCVIAAWQLAGNSQHEDRGVALAENAVGIVSLSVVLVAAVVIVLGVVVGGAL